eukprot:NODE_3893_length_898_cov_38.110718_g3583_i0.p1 GENE.NODE_3893_length_898_cov_38.110718_g3583_i0~~NODE_3893_length_898_cov_38.110718_g3583_i0.p1  ORF type:complete len:262 (-),score=37.20 NODE_3893_length_898_cov_38.110718_g3583_i0:56-841(-)
MSAPFFSYAAPIHGFVPVQPFGSSPMPLGQAHPAYLPPQQPPLPAHHSWPLNLQTTIGDIVLVSEFENALHHAQMALTPVLARINQSRLFRGLTEIMVRPQLVRNRRQTIAAVTEDRRKKHIVIFCFPGTHIRHLDNPKSELNYRGLYNQVNDGFNEILVFVVGPLLSPQFRQSGVPLPPPNPNHNLLYDPLLQNSGIFQGDAPTLRKLKTGGVLSFLQQLNPNQVEHLVNVFADFAQGEARLPTSRKQSKIINPFAPYAR